MQLNAQTTIIFTFQYLIFFPVAGYTLGDLIIEGKTKQVYDLPNNPGLCLLQNKDRITAGDGVKSHALAGKAAISNQTNGKVFGILIEAGLKTAYVKSVSDTAFLSRKCQMIPIECVTRRIATGSFLKRNVGVPEGYRFATPKYETFFKDDANHDPQWSEEQILSANFEYNNVKIGKPKNKQISFQINIVGSQRGSGIIIVNIFVVHTELSYVIMMLMLLRASLLLLQSM